MTDSQTSEYLGMLASAAGILISLIIYAIVQERIMAHPFGEEGEYFTYSAFLVLSNRIVAASIAIGMLMYRKESVQNVAPIYKYFGISISNTVATVCQYEALKYVSFPTQTLGKCGKMISVMILGTLISGKKYTLKDYLMATAVTLGCVLFLLTGDISSHVSEQNDSIYGLLLMLGYMFSDGFTSTFQEKLFKGYTMSTYNQMLYVNICSAVISILGLLGSGQLFPATLFSFKYPDFFLYQLGLSLAASLGQVVIYFTIKTFGALFFSTVMTTRQVISILLSCIIYLHPLTFPQWIAVLIVFGTLYYKANSKKPSSPPPEQKNVQKA